MTHFRFTLSFIISAMFTFQFALAGVTTSKNPLPFDAPRVRFEQTAEGKLYKKKFGQLPDVVDSYGYPMPKTPLKKESSRYQKKITPIVPKPKLGPAIKVLPVKKNPNVTTSILKSVLDFFISSAVAYDEDPLVPGLVNCREGTPAPGSVPRGYFKAYFEDLAFNNGQGSEAGYDEDENNLGLLRVQAACDVLQEIASIIMQDQPYGATPTILFTKDWPADAPLSALASAASYGPGAGFLYQHIISRIDPADGPDAVVNTNWHPSISWSMDSSLNAGSYDFETVMRHEILHAMGFASKLPAVIVQTNIPYNNNLWDRNLFAPIIPNPPQVTDCSISSNCVLFYSTGLSPLLQVPVGSPSQWFINNRSIYQGKKNFVNAPLDGARPLYTPASLQQGSSLSHFDSGRNLQTYVMHPSIGMNEAKGIHEHEKEVLCQIGYQVAGMNGSGCNGVTPVANDDVGTLVSTTTTDIALLNNDEDFNGNGVPSNANLRLHFLQVLAPSVVPDIAYFTQATSTGACDGDPTDLSSARCIRVTTSNSLSLLSIKYQVKNVLTNRISLPGNVVYSRCSVAANEYLCNGDFEMGSLNSTLIGHQFGNNAVPFWGAALHSPDLVERGTGNYIQYVPHQSYLSSGVVVDMAPESNYAGLIVQASSCYTDNPDWCGENNEKVATKLKAPLQVGGCYQLSFDIGAVSNHSLEDGGTPEETFLQISSINVMANLTKDPLVIYSSYNNANPTVINNAPAVLNQPIPVTSTVISEQMQWTHVEKYFAPSQDYEYLLIQLLDPANYQYPMASRGINVISYFDNVSLKKVDSSLCPSNTISGVVYNDISGNHIMNIGEQVLSGVPVGLYSSSGVPLAQSVTSSAGEYKFYSVNPANSYYVAINPESSVQSITEPLQNNILSGHQYTRIVPYTNGGVVTGENFGVLLTGQSFSIPPIITTLNSCNGVSLQVTPSGGAAPYGYLWNGPSGFISTLANPVVTVPGAYSITVNALGYVGSAQVTISPSQVPQLSGSVVMSSNSVSINTTFTGANPTSYSWTGPVGSNYSSTQANASGITLPGVYTITVNYGNSCQKQASFTVVPSCSPAPPPSTFSTLLNTTNNAPLFKCYSSLASNGTRQCIYNNASPASTGNWYAACPSTIAGTNCCGWDVACPPVTISGVVSNSTSGANGGVALSLSGTGPYTYLWSNGQTTQNLSNVPAGQYTVIVKNANGCQSQKSFQVHNQMQVSLSKVQACTVASNTMSATVTGGAAPYTYRWFKNGVAYPSASSPFTGSTAIGVPVGSYYVVVTDANGQIFQSTALGIDAYLAPSVALVKTDATGTAYNNGTIKATVTGGVAPFNYFFTGLNAMSTGPIATNPYIRSGLTGYNDAPAVYGVFVIDYKNCQSNTVNGIKVLRKLTATSKVVADCSTGSTLPLIQVTPVGGHGNYTYQWKQGTTVIGSTNSSSLFGAAAGNYTVTVTDHSTPTPQSVTLAVTMPLTAPILHTASVAVVNTTNGLSNGSATVTTTAGLGPYTYTYTPGTAFTNILTNTHSRTALAAGTYSVSVKTFNGCSIPKSFTIKASATAAPVLK